MKIYKVKVNGKVYEVELESVSEKEGTIAAPVQAAPAAALVPATDLSKSFLLYLNIRKLPILMANASCYRS